MKNITVPKLLQDISVIIASLLPIAQLFFSQFQTAFDEIFLAKDQFIGISVITLILSYIIIIAYLTKPYAEIPLPFQKKKSEALKAYWQKSNQLNELVRILQNSEAGEKALLSLTKQLSSLEQPSPPIKISPENHVAISLTTVILSAGIFIGLSFVESPTPIILVAQSLAYTILIPFSALMLTIYKKLVDNNREWRENRIARSDKAIKLAIDANSFAELPQVKFLAQYETNGWPQAYHVFAEYKGVQYDVVTDNNAEYLISVSQIVENTSNQA